MNKNKIKIYCDFDGTITLKDLSDELFKHYGNLEPYNSMLRKNEISIYDYWKMTFKSLPSKFSKKDLENFALQQEIDTYFYDFCIFCKQNTIPISIVSDGYIEYIYPILKKFNLDFVNVFSNRLIFADSIMPVFTGATESCKCPCASCKRNVILNNSSDGDIIIFIGDGYSDFCVAEHSDIIFAKKYLAKYCTENKIPHYHFKSFFDVKKILSEIIINKGKLKPRRQAQIKRKDAFESE